MKNSCIREKRWKILEHLLPTSQNYSVIRSGKRKKRYNIFCRRSRIKLVTSFVSPAQEFLRSKSIGLLGRWTRFLRVPCMFLPSKQAVAGSSPVSRFFLTSSLFAGCLHAV